MERFGEPFWSDLKDKEYPLYSLWIVFCLGFSSGLPMGLLTGALQAWFADVGCSLATIGLVGLMGLPYAYRFLWAPMVDHFVFKSLGRRRGWMILMQALLWFGFFLLPMGSPGVSSGFILILSFVLCICSATQDTIIDAHRIEFLPARYHALGASCAIIGYRIALLLGAGGTLIIADHWGWAVAYRVVSCFMGIGLMAAVYSTEPLLNRTQQASLSFIQSFRALRDRCSFIPLIFFILTYKWAEAFTSTNSAVMIPFLLQTLGLSLDVLAYINKGLGLSAAILGSLLAGFLVIRYALTQVLMCCGALQALNVLWFIVLSQGELKLPLLCTAVFFENLSSGMGSVCLVAFLMKLVIQPYTATQFSMLVALATLPRLFAGSIAAALVPIIGWSGLFWMTFVIALFYLPFLKCLIRHLE